MQSLFYTRIMAHNSANEQREEMSKEMRGRKEQSILRRESEGIKCSQREPTCDIYHYKRSRRGNTPTM